MSQHDSDKVRSQLHEGSEPERSNTEANSERSLDVTAFKALIRLIANRPIPYLVGVTVWAIIEILPILPAFIGQSYVDGLLGAPGAPSLALIVGALSAYTVTLVTMIFIGLYQYSSVVFRAYATKAQNVFASILSRPGAISTRLNTGETLSRFRDDLTLINTAFDNSVDFVGPLITVIVGFLIALKIDSDLAFVVFGPIVFVVFLIRFMAKYIEQARREARDATEEVTSILGESFSAIQAIKAAGAERNLVAALEAPNVRRRDKMVKDSVLEAVANSLTDYGIDIATGLVLIISASSIATADGLSIGEFTFLTYLLGFMGSLANMIAINLVQVRQAGVSILRISDLLEDLSRTNPHKQDLVELLTHHRPLDQEPESLLTTFQSPGGTSEQVGGARAGSPLISVRGLDSTFAESTETDAGRHNQDRRVFRGVRDICFDIEPGEFVVVTGMIGSGKSTLLRTLLGLVPKRSGQVFYKGQELDDLANQMVPPISAYTPQVPTLFSMSLQENLKLGAEADSDQIDSALRDAVLLADIGQFPDGLETELGTRGLRLSGGQVQRCATARMLLRRPELLVIDDVSSALDVTTEERLWANLFDKSDEDSGGYRPAVLAVSHRRQALNKADKILVLDNGRIVASGTASELEQSSELYRTIVT